MKRFIGMAKSFALITVLFVLSPLLLAGALVLSGFQSIAQDLSDTTGR